MTMADVWAALEEGDAERLGALLKAQPELAESRDGAGVSLVLRTLYQGRRDLARLVLAANPGLDGFDAAALDQVDRLDEGLAADPDLPARHTGDGFTALHLAAFFGAEHTAERLLAAGANPNAVAANGSRVQPLHSAVAGRATDVVRLLLRSGADVDARQEGGFTPLHGAANAGDPELVLLLLDAGAALDATTDEGLSALAIAERGGHDRAAQLLRDRLAASQRPA
jgi:ankyrin repeat protein